MKTSETGRLPRVSGKNRLGEGKNLRYLPRLCKRLHSNGQATNGHGALRVVFRNLPLFGEWFHNGSRNMPYLPNHQAPRRPDRVRFAETVPVVFRLQDGNRASGRLKVVSITGGLLALPRPIRQGLIGKLMFLTSKGSVLGSAEMLTPLSWELQPFKFISLPDDDHTRLQCAINASLKESHREREQTLRNATQLEKLRAW